MSGSVFRRIFGGRRGVRDDIRAKVEMSGGLQEFDQALDNDDELVAALNLQAITLRRTARNMIKRPSGGGKTYIVRRDGVSQPHRASAPGEFPASVTGETARKITIKRARNRPGKPIVAKVSAKALQSYWLEFGTVTMRARPFMGPALRAIRSASTSELRAAAKRMVAKAAKRAAARAQRKAGGA